MRRAVRVAAVALLWLVGAALVALLAYQASVYARVWWWTEHNPSSTSFMDDRLAAMRRDDPRARLRHEWVAYARIARSLKLAVIAAEDTAFVDHEGFDWKGIEQAFEKNLKKGRIVAGGSTITQQLAKNLFLSGERSYARKVQEALITWMLESRMEKDRILEIYLNVVEWGNGVFGAQAAARHYFGVDAGRLTREQAARLAAMLPNPRYYDRNRDSAYLARRVPVILARMNQVEAP
ncbi:MAG: monofunctional biosynthetic peptidoglycan transglycosylase [Burkholderiales bacterium]|nr:monofunctional biosynthetic peptidoglycan transglycosylase [Burkholderiales bacterium]